MSHVERHRSSELRPFTGQRQQSCYPADVAALRPSPTSALRLQRPSRTLPARATR